MNGIHDMGGMHGFGPVEPEPDEPVFHHDWERRVFALSIAMRALRKYSVDEFRYAIETMGNAHYLDTSYYEHWLHGLETLAVRTGMVTREELDAKIRQKAGA